MHKMKQRQFFHCVEGREDYEYRCRSISWFGDKWITSFGFFYFFNQISNLSLAESVDRGGDREDLRILGKDEGYLEAQIHQVQGIQDFN